MGLVGDQEQRGPLGVCAVPLDLLALHLTALGERIEHDELGLGLLQDLACLAQALGEGDGTSGVLEDRLDTFEARPTVVSEEDHGVIRGPRDARRRAQTPSEEGGDPSNPTPAPVSGRDVPLSVDQGGVVARILALEGWQDGPVGFITTDLQSRSIRDESTGSRPRAPPLRKPPAASDGPVLVKGLDGSVQTLRFANQQETPI